MLTFSTSGDLSKTDQLLAALGKLNLTAALSAYGQQGVNALASATPKDSGLTSESWGYEVSHESGVWKITWTNIHVDSQGAPIAILLQYGHGTGTGGYVQGRDYINPAMKPIFDAISEGVWKAVMSK